MNVRPTRYTTDLTINDPNKKFTLSNEKPKIHFQNSAEFFLQLDSIHKRIATDVTVSSQ